MAAVVPAVMAAGQGFPVDQDAQVRADGLAVINQQQAQIRQLQERVLQGQLQGQQTAQRYEDQLFAMSQEQEALLVRLAASQQQIDNMTRLFELRQTEVQELQRRQVQDAAQIAAGQREVTAISQQLVQERAQVQLLRQQLQVTSNQVQQLIAQVDQLQRMHRETLAMVQKQQNPEKSSFFFDVAALFLRGLQGFPPSAYTPKEY